MEHDVEHDDDRDSEYIISADIAKSLMVCVCVFVCVYVVCMCDCVCNILLYLDNGCMLAILLQTLLIFYVCYEYTSAIPTIYNHYVYTI